MLKIKEQLVKLHNIGRNEWVRIEEICEGDLDLIAAIYTSCKLRFHRGLPNTKEELIKLTEGLRVIDIESGRLGVINLAYAFVEGSKDTFYAIKWDRIKGNSQMTSFWRGRCTFKLI